MEAQVKAQVQAGVRRELELATNASEEVRANVVLQVRGVETESLVKVGRSEPENPVREECRVSFVVI